MCIPDSNSAKALSDPRSAGDPLKYLATFEYNCLYSWNLSLGAWKTHMNKVPIAVKTIGAELEHAWCDTLEEGTPIPGWTTP